MMSDQSRTAPPAPTGTPDNRRLRRAGHLLITLPAVILFASSVVAHAQQRSQEELWKEINSLAWQNYPAVGVIGNEAQIRLTNDIRFLDTPNTNKFVQLNGNPPINNAYTIATRLLDWFAIFEFDPIGYVRDDEKIDPDELLKLCKNRASEGLKKESALDCQFSTLQVGL